MAVLQELWLRAKEIRREDGLIALVKASAKVLISPMYKRDLYYLYEKRTKADYHLSLSGAEIGEENLHFVVVSSNQEADKLEKEGYKFRTYPTTHNNGRATYTRWLDEGVTAFCTFKGKEFVAIIWVIPSEKVQKRVSLPIKVDYSKGEVFPRGAWVHPDYRGLGLIRYTVQQRDRFLSEKGIGTIRSTVSYSNKVGSGMSEGLGARIYGRARMVRILWWKFWKENYEIPLRT